jgi:hypothetical protein
MARGSDISASDYVAIQNKAESILGTGIGSRGYGQTVVSTDVFSGNQITKLQWDLLRYDITNIKVHQDGVLPPIITVSRGETIGYNAASPNTNYNTLVESAIANRFAVATSQSVITLKDTKTYSSTWTTSASATLTATFSTAEQARYFFNSGGKFRVTTQLTGGSSTSQVNAWTNFLNSVGTQSFGAATGSLANYKTLTNSYQTAYQGSLTTPYSSNNYRLEARCNVANNSTGTATTVDLRILLTDGYVDPGNSGLGDNPNTIDRVDGTLTIIVEELKASGSLIPTGTFTITSPTYSLSAIAAS